VIAAVARRLDPLGFRRQGECIWRVRADGKAFAGLVFRSRVWRESKRLVFYVSIQGAHSRFHHLNPERKTDEFQLLEANAQYGSDISDPHGHGQRSKEWTLFPSSECGPVAESVWDRISNEAVPLIDELLDDHGLEAALRAHKVWPNFPELRAQIVAAPSNRPMS
jgi:hypothetical protein